MSYPCIFTCTSLELISRIITAGPIDCIFLIWKISKLYKYILLGFLSLIQSEIGLYFYVFKLSYLGKKSC